MYREWTYRGLGSFNDVLLKLYTALFATEILDLDHFKAQNFGVTLFIILIIHFVQWCFELE